MNLKKGDKVIVIAGKEKGKEGTITKIFKTENKVLIENINLMKKHRKSDGQNPGSIVEIEAPINASNVMILDPTTNKPTRVGKTINKNNKKVRITKKSKKELN